MGSTSNVFLGHSSKTPRTQKHQGMPPDFSCPDRFKPRQRADILAVQCIRSMAWKKAALEICMRNAKKNGIVQTGGKG